MPKTDQLLNYTFNASAKKITFTDYVSIRLDKIMGVINATVNLPIYVPNTVGYGGTVAGNVLTFTASNAGMSNGDSLIIKYTTQGTDTVFANTITGIDENGVVKTVPIISGSKALEGNTSLPVTPTPVKTIKCTFSKDYSNLVDPVFLAIKATGSGMSVNQKLGNLILSSGTTANAETVIRSVSSFKDAWALRYSIILSQRIANFSTILEMVDVVGDSLAMSNISTASYTLTNCMWTRATTTLTVFAPNHFLTTGDSVTIANMTDTSVLANGAATVLAATNNNVFTITCANTGAAGGTLDFTSPTKPSVDITIPGTTFTAANVNQQVTLCAINNGTGGSSPLIIPTDYRIHAVVGTTITLTGLTGSTSGTFGTGASCSMVGWNFVRVIYDGASQTTWRFDTQRRGFNNGYGTLATNATSPTTTTTAASVLSFIQCEDNEVRFLDTTAYTSTAFGNANFRGARVQNIPDDSVSLFLQFRQLNGTSSPATAGSAAFGFFQVEDYSSMPVTLINSRSQTTQGVSIVQNLANATIQQVQGSAADAAAIATAVAMGGRDTGGLTRTISTSDGGGMTGPGEIVSLFTAFSAGNATPAEGTNCKTIAAFSGKDCEVQLGIYAQGNAADTIQVEGSYDLITWAVIPMTRIDGIVTTAMFAQLGAWIPVTNASYRGKSYGYGWVRVHQVARTTTGTSGIIRILPLPDTTGTSLTSAFTIDAANTTEAAGTANGALMAGGVRTLNIASRSSAKAVIVVDALTYGTAAPTTATLVVEGLASGASTWSTLSLQPWNGGATVTSITGNYGTVSMPVGGVWETDVGSFVSVRVRCSVLTLGTSVAPRFHGALKLVSVPTVAKITSEGNMTVQLGGSNVSPFNDIVTAELTPVVQLSFHYGLLTSMGAATTANSATVDTNLSRLRLQSGTNSAGSAVYTSREPARYRTGQGVVARFTALWDGATASNTQFVGLNTTEDAYGFGFNGIAFGIRFKYFTTDTWIAQTAWNGDLCDGTGKSGFNWDKTKGNVMMIKYPFLGYGPITFWVMHPTGYWILCHTILYPNSSTSTQIQNANMFFVASNINSGSTTARIMYVGSVGLFSCGKTEYPCSPQWGIDSSKATITTETNLLTLKVATTYNGIANRGLVRLRNISFANTVNTLSAAGVATYRLKLGASLGGSPSYTTISGSTADAGVTITSGNSMVSYDVAGTTVSNGTYKFSQVISQNGNNTFDLTPFSLYLLPGDTMTISAAAGTSATCAVAINWDEEV